MLTPEEKARDLLERAGIGQAQNMTSGDLAELANIIAKAEGTPDLYQGFVNAVPMHNGFVAAQADDWIKQFQPVAISTGEFSVPNPTRHWWCFWRPRVPLQLASSLNERIKPLDWAGMKGKPGEIYRLTVDFDVNGDICPEAAITRPQGMLKNGLTCEGITIKANGNTVIAVKMWRKLQNGCDIDPLELSIKIKGAP